MAGVRLTEEQWEEIRAKREVNGATFRELAEEYGVSHVSIAKRAKAGKWDDGANHEQTIKRRVNKRVNKISAVSDPVKLNDEINAEVTRRAEMIERHRSDWLEVRRLEKEAIAEQDTDERVKLTRALKQLTDQMVARQNQERKLWGIDVELSVDEIKNLSDEELAKALGRD